jgi:xylulose-5-phosphate/fructose-6-phosphate phosphoketolase
MPDATAAPTPASDDLLTKMHAYWRAANYLSVGQIYLFKNPLLRTPLTVEDIKPRLLGHFGTTPGLNFIYVHCNRAIKQYDLNMIYVAGPGHGGPGMVANTYLEGTYSELYPDITPDAAGMQKLFKQFSFPGGIPSHASPDTPGSIHEGGELGYSLSHAFGAAFDNPDLIVTCVVGDGEAETGPLATSWHSNKFLNPVTDGAVLPVLHLNGYKIAGPTVLARIEPEELDHLLRGYGYTPHYVEGDDPATMHRLMADTLDTVVQQIKQIQSDARGGGLLAPDAVQKAVVDFIRQRCGIVIGEREAGEIKARIDTAAPTSDDGSKIKVKGRDPATGQPREAEVTTRELHGLLQGPGTRGVVRPRWPMIVLRSPKGWTGPDKVDGKQILGTFRAHQVPMEHVTDSPAHMKILDDWLRSYKADELFDEHGTFRPELAELAPKGDRRMGANPHANGGLLLRELALPDFRTYAVKIDGPGKTMGEATRVQGTYLRDVMTANPHTFRLMSPDETASNRLSAVFDVTVRESTARVYDYDDHVGPAGRVMEMLSEHQCEGWLEGYLLTGRHGLFSCYEAFIHIVDSMFNQHAKWLEACHHIPWRRPVASLNYMLSSHVWRQDHNGFSHQDPGFIDVVMNKRPSVVRAYFPPDANCLLSVTDHVLRSRDYVNVVTCGKQPSPQWLDMDAAVKHCTAGLSIWEWASNDRGGDPDVVMACCGDVPTLETLAAVSILRREFPDLKVRVINVVDLMKLMPADQHPHGLKDKDFDVLFTCDRPVIFAYHAYPALIHRLTYDRANHANIHVKGFIERGTTTTPFDMVVLNDLDRFHLVGEVVDRVEKLRSRAAYVKQMIHDKLIEHRAYVDSCGQDLPEVRDWVWEARTAGGAEAD